MDSGVADDRGESDSDAGRKQSVTISRRVLIVGAIATAVAVGLIVAVVVVLTGNESGSKPATVASSEHSLKGSVTILLTPYSETRGCFTSSTGYADISPGAAVVVEDGSGTTLATGRLSEPTQHPQIKAQCTWSFSLLVPDADFYRLTIGGRDPLTYSSAELKTLDWTVNLKLG